MTQGWIADSVRKLAIVAMMVVAVSSIAQAQESATTQQLTLQQTVRMALQQNPAFQSSTDEADAARAVQASAIRMVSTFRLSPGLHAWK